MALNRSPEFCLKLTYRYLLKAGHVPVDNWGGPILVLGHNLNKLGRGLLGHATSIWYTLPLHLTVIARVGCGFKN